VSPPRPCSAPLPPATQARLRGLPESAKGNGYKEKQRRKQSDQGKPKTSAQATQQNKTKLTPHGISAFQDMRGLVPAYFAAPADPPHTHTHTHTQPPHAHALQPTYVRSQMGGSECRQWRAEVDSWTQCARGACAVRAAPRLACTTSTAQPKRPAPPSIRSQRCTCDSGRTRR